MYFINILFNKKRAEKAVNKSFLIFIFMLVCSQLSWSQGPPANSKVNCIDDTDLAFLWYHSIYSQSPSLLSHWNIGNRSYLSFGYNKEKGEFHHPQSYDRLSSFNFETKSFFRQKESVWSFFGMFTYSNGRADSVSTNLSYDIGKDGSPYYYFIKRAGNWNLQHYSFDAVASREMNSKLSMAGNVKYNGSQFFRLVDTRNNQTKLDIVLRLSATYNINKQDYLSIGVNYTYDKTQPSFSDMYQHSSDGLLYNIYLNAGMGSYFKGADYPSVIQYRIPGITLQWLLHRNKETTSFAYSFNKGKQTWKDKSIVRTDKQNIISKYNTGVHKLSIQTIRSNNQSTLDAALDVGLTSGKGHQLNKTTSIYIQNYNHTGFDAKLKTKIIREEHVLNRIMLGAQFDYKKQRDKNYAYSLMYTNFDLYAGVRFNIRFLQKTTFIEVKPGYHRNIHFENNIGAASGNIYNNWIGVPVSEFFASNWFYVASKIGVENTIKELPIKLQLHVNFTNPSMKDEDNLPDRKRGDHFLELGCILNIYF